MTTDTVPTIKLNNGTTIPQLGLGTAGAGDPETRRNVAQAVDLGYRLIDTAAKYENEVGVGQGIADAAAAGVEREQLYVTTKLRGREQGFAETKRALDSSLLRLGLDYVDLYLIHWPLPRQNRYVESWNAMEELVAEGKAHTIGVSNFLPGHLDRLAAESSTVPAVNQIEVHPQLPQREQLEDDARRGIVTESWSPLANGGLLNDGVLHQIADQHGKSVAQVVLAWHLGQGLVTVPKASHESRLRENLDVFDLELTPENLAAIATLDTGTRCRGQDPRTHEEF
jgi:diketogulonate reductase-like aldo/keto reductase